MGKCVLGIKDVKKVGKLSRVIYRATIMRQLIKKQVLIRVPSVHTLYTTLLGFSKLFTHLPLVRTYPA